jgi:hypothetical protein
MTIRPFSIKGNLYYPDGTLRIHYEAKGNCAFCGRYFNYQFSVQVYPNSREPPIDDNPDLREAIESDVSDRLASIGLQSSRKSGELYNLYRIFRLG